MIEGLFNVKSKISNNNNKDSIPTCIYLLVESNLSFQLDEYKI